MKIAIGTLLLYTFFVILLSSTQLSAQSDDDGLPDSETFENVPAGHTIRLSNGHKYTSLGNEVIQVRYNSITGDAFIRQGTRTGRTSTRVYPSQETFEHIPRGTRINLANDHTYASLSTQPICVHYNTANGVAHVRQGTKITVLGEEGFLNYPRNYHYTGESSRSKNRHD